NLAFLSAAAMRRDEATAWGRRSFDLADRLNLDETAAWSLVRVGASEGDVSMLEQSLDRARQAGLVALEANTLLMLADAAVENRRHTDARLYTDEGIALCEH